MNITLMNVTLIYELIEDATWAIFEWQHEGGPVIKRPLKHGRWQYLSVSKVIHRELVKKFNDEIADLFGSR